MSSLFYLLSWVPDTIIVIVKYRSSENVDSISLSGIFLHQYSLEVAPYSWEWQTQTEGCGTHTSLSRNHKWFVLIIRRGLRSHSSQAKSKTLMTNLLLNAGYMGTVLVMRTASYFLSVVDDNSVSKRKRTLRFLGEQWSWWLIWTQQERVESLFNRRKQELVWGI